MPMTDSTSTDGTTPASVQSGVQTPGEAAAAAHTSDLPTPGQHHTGSLWRLTLGSIGVVYGDIGTSPIYAMRESLHAASRNGLTRADVIGVISLLIWALILIVSFKYVTLIMRADNRGEGGTLSLVALVQQALSRRPVWLLALGMVGISLFFGDAIITPAMSVLSAVEGMSLVTPALDRYVVPITLAIIVGIFLVQRRGTGAVSVFFGPVMVTWFLVMAAMGLLHIGDDWSILRALSPTYAAGFLVTNGWASLIVLGSVFLAVTGGEALYADMGHFGRLPIRLAWVGLVWPALTLSYLGQGAMVLSHPEAAENPFFLMAPGWALLPLVILATFATIIASQAVISGAFSMMKQAVGMGLLPRLEIRHTSESQEGQIYLPKVNAILAVGVVILVLVFGSSSDLASAYGIAVTGDMVITTVLASFVFFKVWRWSLPLVVAVVVPLLLLELLFLGSNALKIPQGGYVPILMAATMVFAMWTWVRGTSYILKRARQTATPLTALIEKLEKSTEVQSVAGTAVFLTADPDVAPSALIHNLKHNRVLHERNLILSVSVETRPYVPEAERLSMKKLSDRFTRIDMHFGYMEEPNIPRALGLARKQGLKFDIMATSFFLSRRSFRHSKEQGLPTWQESLYIGLSRSAANATDFYHLPINRVIELGQQFLI
jgi:KUP system potassium uptake protein